MLYTHWDRTNTLPPSLSSKPENRPEHEWYFDIFNLLSRHRVWDDGTPQPIPLKDLFFVLDEHRVFDGEYRSFVCRLIGEMDNAYITHFAELRAQKIEEMKNKK